MKTMITASVIVALMSGSAMAGDRAGCGYGGEASVTPTQSSASVSSEISKPGVEREGVLTAQSDTRTIRQDENVRSGGTSTGGSGAPAPNTTGK